MNWYFTSICGSLFLVNRFTHLFRMRTPLGESAQHNRQPNHSFLNIFGVLYFMNRLRSINHKALKTGELLVREGMARQEDVDAALDVQLKEGDAEIPSPASSYSINRSDDIPEGIGIRTIGEILCSLDLVSPIDLNRVLLKYGKRLKLGGMLKKMGIISDAQIRTALESQQFNFKSLGQILIEQEFITEKQLYDALSRQHNLQYKRVDGFEYAESNKAELIQIIGHNYADENSIIPLTLEGNKLTLAVYSPENMLSVHELKNVYAYLRIECVLILQDRFKELFKELYGVTHSHPLETRTHIPTASDIQEKKPETPSIEDEEEPDVPSDEDMEAFIQYLLKYGITKNADSIHIEQIGEGAAIRYRIGGNLKGLDVPGLGEKLPRLIRDLIHKLKEKAGLDDSDHENPQSGLVRIRFFNRETNKQAEVGFRISVLPTSSGDIVTLTAQTPSASIPSIDDQDHSVHTKTALKRLLEASTGIILISGSEKSGKEQTLFASIKHLYGPDRKILMASESEQPEIAGVIQARVNQDHLTYEQLLRAFLDHDPDVIVVDTIKDMGTARAVVTAAGSGQLILCGIDAEDAVDAMWKLMAFGVERESIAQRVNGIISQQRVRRVCPSCRKAYTPEPEEWNVLFDSFPARLAFHKGAGCTTCGLIGYAGHTILSEVLIIDGEISQALRTQAEQTVIRQIAMASGNKTLVDDGLLKLKQTTLDEIVRAVPFKMIVAYKTAKKSGKTGNDRSEVSYETIKKEWILSSSHSEEARILEMYQDLKLFRNEDRGLDPDEKNIFYDFISETFHQVCRDYKCRRVLFCMESHPGDLSFWAAPVFVKRHG